MIELMVLPGAMLLYLVTWQQAEAATTKSLSFMLEGPPVMADPGQLKIEEARGQWLQRKYWWQ